jgi:thiol-disulfide isomerase/thioredoxin
LFPLALLPACNRGSHPAQTGKPAPDFTVSDGTSTVHLASYRGKVVLLNFWASWCMPCVEEMPSLLALHHQDPNLVILAVSIDDDPAAYATFIVRDHTDMWPETYVIDRKGIIRSKLVGPQEWTSPEIVGYLNSL